MAFGFWSPFSFYSLRARSLTIYRSSLLRTVEMTCKFSDNFCVRWHGEKLAFEFAGRLFHMYISCHTSIKFVMWGKGCNAYFEIFGVTTMAGRIKCTTWSPKTCCIAIFHKYCCYIKCGGITTNLILWNHGGYVTDVPKYHSAGVWSTD